MKKSILSGILTSALVVTAAVTLCACSSNKSTTSDSTQKQNVASSTDSADKSTAQSQDQDSPYSSLPYYLSDKLEAYKAYASLHQELSAEDVVTYVNIGLDTAYYSNTKVIEKPDDMLVLCNKYHSLPENYVPADLVDITTGNAAASGLKLRKEAAAAFDKLCAAAKESGYKIMGASAYRSFAYQKTLYNNYVASDGAANADTYSARPGFSEHQTGLAVDVKNATTAYDKFGSTKEYQWAKDNIYKYGFIIRYLPSTIHITGYKSEEWHFRYVGVETATAVYKSGLTYDEYYTRNMMK